MVSILNGLRNSVILDLGRVVPNRGGLRSWLPTANVIPEGETDDVIIFDLPYFDQISPYLAGEFSRFSLASAESLFRSFDSGPSQLNFLSWRLLELYYSGFFAAHAVMRALGCGVMVIDEGSVERFKEIGKIYGVPLEDMGSGSWFYRARASDDGWKFEISKTANGKGVHDAFWRQFCKFILSSAQQALDDGLPDADQFVVASVELVDAITVGDAGSASWLASLRNEINYRHELQVWFPPSRKHSISISDLTRTSHPSEGFKPGLSKAKMPLAAFENTLSHLAYLSFEISQYIAKQSNRRGYYGASFQRLCAMR